MDTPSDLLQLIGQALLTAIDDSVLNDVTVASNPEMAEAVWSAWHQHGDEAQLRAELQGLAAAGAADIEQAITEVMGQIGTGRTADVCQAATSYLAQVPAAIRRRFRRPADPAGTTAPAWLSLRQPADLLALLPAQMPWFEPGDRPWEIGDWELVELLDVGGFGEVWKAHSPRQTDVEPVTLKFCLHSAAKERLLQPETGGAALLDRVLQKARHPGIVQLRQLYLNANPPCLEYEYVEGGDLTSLIQDWHAGQGTPAPPLVAAVVLQLAQTLGFLHQLKPPLVHRDLRPAAVLVRQGADGRLQCKIADLGLGELMPLPTAEEHKRRTAGAAPPAGREGDPLVYASPEQRRGAAPDPRDDVYALGVLWYQMLTGNLDAGRPGGSQWRRRLAETGMPAGMIELLEACFEDDATYRPADGAVLAGQLAQLLGNADPGEAPRRGPAPAEDVARGRRVAPSGQTQPADAGQGASRGRQRRADVWQLFDSLEKKGPELAKLLTNSLGLKLVLLPAGTFQIGSPADEMGRRDNEGPQHEVAIMQGFYLGVCQVTQAQYEQVMSKNPSRFSPSNGGSAEHPVENVSWDDAVAFCRRLSELRDERAAARTYRLPTEAEWEYACRGGTTTPFCYGAALSSDQANFDGHYPYGGSAQGRSAEKTTRVGAYPPNNFGLYDMHGNVWEWCADWLDSRYYSNSPRRDPKGPDAGQFRVLRGGSWRNHAVTCRAAYRNGLGPRSRDSYTGFRVVLDVSH